MHLLVLLARFSGYLLSKGECWGVGFSVDSKFVGSCGESGNVTLWNLQTLQKEQVLNSNAKFTISIAFVSEMIPQLI